MDTSGQYTVYFEVTRIGYEWWATGLGLALVLMGWIIRRAFKQSSWALFRLWSFSGSLMLWFGCLWTLVLLGTTLPGYLVAQYAYRAGHYAVVAERVTNFDPATYDHRIECFTVSAERFCYSDNLMEPGFHQTTSRGGPIRDGLPVRIAYSNGTILRLEIEADD